MPRVLIVEDDEVIAQGMARHLDAAGFDPVWVANGDQGLARLRYEKPDVCVLDLMLPGVDGWKLIETARIEGIPSPIIVVAARVDAHFHPDALRRRLQARSGAKGRSPRFNAALVRNRTFTRGTPTAAP